MRLQPWIVEEYPWGTAVRHYKGNYDHIVLSPSGQVVDVSGLSVELHDNGIEIIGVKDDNKVGEIIPFNTKGVTE